MCSRWLQREAEPWTTQVRAVQQKPILCCFFFISFLKSILCFALQRGQNHLLSNSLPPKQSSEIHIVEKYFLQVQLSERHETAFKIWCSSEVTYSWGSTELLLKAQLWQPWNHHHVAFLFLEVLHYELIWFNARCSSSALIPSVT